MKKVAYFIMFLLTVFVFYGMGMILSVTRHTDALVRL